jgi:hypothetical protein
MAHDPSAGGGQLHDPGKLSTDPWPPSLTAHKAFTALALRHVLRFSPPDVRVSRRIFCQTTPPRASRPSRGHERCALRRRPPPPPKKPHSPPPPPPPPPHPPQQREVRRSSSRGYLERGRTSYQISYSTTRSATRRSGLTPTSQLAAARFITHAQRSARVSRSRIDACTGIGHGLRSRGFSPEVHPWTTVSSHFFFFLLCAQ